MGPSTRARVTTSLLDALVEVIESASCPSAAEAQLQRAAARIASALTQEGSQPAAPEHQAPSTPQEPPELAMQLGALAAQLLPGSVQLVAAADRASIGLPLGDTLDAAPPVRVKLVAAVLGHVAAQQAGHARVSLDLHLIDGSTVWRTSVLIAPAGEAAPNEQEYEQAAPLAQAAPAAPTLAAEADSADTRAHPPTGDARLLQLGHLAASVAHGLNNLLGAVAGQSSELLAATNGHAPPADVQASGLRLIHQAALDGAGLAQRLLRASRGEPAQGTDTLELVDLGQVLVDAVDLTRMRWHDEALQRGIVIEPTVEVGQPLLIRGVAADLREIVVNLILNAVDAMPEGGRLSLRGDLANDVVTVTCQDTGQGMSPSVQARLFEPFFTTKGKRGTGMGMAILHAVVARHGGEVRVRSCQGTGTCVTLQLPAAQLRHGQRLAAPRPKPAAPVDLTPELQDRTILVVEDDASFRAIFSRRLALDARRVESAPDAASALTLLEAGTWDLVCIDEGLPDRSGRSVAAEIQARELAGAVILMTGSATGPDDPAFATVGVDAVLPKPCSDAELARAIRTALARTRVHPGQPHAAPA